MSELIGVQKKFAPNSICFGCGPANEKGLKIDSHRIEGGLITLNSIAMVPIFQFGRIW